MGIAPAVSGECRNVEGEGGARAKQTIRAHKAGE